MFPLAGDFGWMAFWGLNPEWLNHIHRRPDGESLCCGLCVWEGPFPIFELYPGICLKTEEDSDCEGEIYQLHRKLQGLWPIRAMESKEGIYCQQTNENLKFEPRSQGSKQPFSGHQMVRNEKWCVTLHL
jgi:hypothetical protein